MAKPNSTETAIAIHKFYDYCSERISMKEKWIEKEGQTIELPSLTAVIEKESNWYVSTCPELGVASQGRTKKEAYAMLSEAVQLWLGAASAKEIRRRIRRGAALKPLELAQA